MRRRAGRKDRRSPQGGLPLWWRCLRFGFPVASILLCAGLAVWLIYIGWPQAQWRQAKLNMIAMTQRDGFAISEVYVTGRQAASRESLLKAVNVKRGDPLFAFDPKAARDSLLTVPWIETAEVERHWPDSISVTVTERKPVARWQLDKQEKLVDKNGIVLSDFVPQNEMDLPLVVGKGAPMATADLMEELESRPLFAKALRAAVRVGQRRWDLYMDSAILATDAPSAQQAANIQKDDLTIIRLPASQAEEEKALGRLEELGSKTDLFQRSLTSIDLRMPDRLVLRLRPTGDNKIAVSPSPDQSDRRIITGAEDADSGIDEDQGAQSGQQE